MAILNLLIDQGDFLEHVYTEPNTFAWITLTSYPVKRTQSLHGLVGVPRELELALKT